MKSHDFSCLLAPLQLLMIPLVVQTSTAQAPATRLPRFTPATGEVESRSGTSATLGHLAADLPSTVVPEQEFELDLEMVPRSEVLAESTRVYLDQTDRVRYQPRAVLLSPGNRATIKVIVHRTRSGLSEISAVARGWDPLRVTVSSGFRGRLASSLGNSVEGGRSHTFTMAVVDSLNRPLPVDAPVALRLSATGALLRSATTTTVWRPELVVYLAQGASRSELIEINPRSRTGSSAQIQAVLSINDDTVLMDHDFQIAIRPAWWFSLMLTVLGGLLYSLYHIAQRFRRTRRSFSRFATSVALPTVISGVAAGVAAYLLASRDILGIQVDTTAPQGFVILGALFAYVGVDAVLESIKPKAGEGQAAGKPPAG